MIHEAETRNLFKRVLVTGASGFVANCAVRRLLNENCDVHILLRDEAKMWRLSDIQDRLHIHRANIIDAAAVRSVMQAAAPEVVLHLAAYGAYEAQAEARHILETNILGAYNVLEASIAAKVRLFINTGSSSEYGYRNEAMQESDRVIPNSVYAVAKAAQTHLCGLLAQSGEMAVVTFRLFSVYGPWEEPARLFPTILQRARAGLRLEMVSPDTVRDFIYVEDVLDALLNFDALTRMKGEVFNLGSGRQSTMRDVVAAVQAAVGDRSEVRWGGMKARRWDSTCWQADISKARTELGWEPKISLLDGVQRMAEWIEQAGDAYTHG